MFSFAVKNNSLRFLLALLVLVIGAALEELLPKFFGVGFPVLLMSVPVFAVRPPWALPVLFALAAGGAEDALSTLPYMTSASFFFLLATVVRWTHLPHLVAPFAYPIYQLWLGIWGIGLTGSIYLRILLAIPIGFFVYLVVWSVITFIERRAGADEAG